MKVKFYQSCAAVTRDDGYIITFNGTGFAHSIILISDKKDNPIIVLYCDKRVGGKLANYILETCDLHFTYLLNILRKISSFSYRTQRAHTAILCNAIEKRKLRPYEEKLEKSLKIKRFTMYNREIWNRRITAQERIDKNDVIKVKNGVIVKTEEYRIYHKIYLAFHIYPDSFVKCYKIIEGMAVTIVANDLINRLKRRETARYIPIKEISDEKIREMLNALSDTEREKVKIKMAMELCTQ